MPSAKEVYIGIGGMQEGLTVLLLLAKNAPTVLGVVGSRGVVLRFRKGELAESVHRKQQNASGPKMLSVLLAPKGPDRWRGGIAGPLSLSISLMQEVYCGIGRMQDVKTALVNYSACCDLRFGAMP